MHKTSDKKVKRNKKIEQNSKHGLKFKKRNCYHFHLNTLGSRIAFLRSRHGYFLFPIPETKTKYFK